MQRHPLLLSVVLALLTCPFDGDHPVGALDASWGFALHAEASGSAGAVPVTFFTYGPLGFLAVPVAWGHVTFALAVIYALAVQVALCRVLLARLGRLLPFLAAVAITAGLALMVDTNRPELLVVVCALLTVEVLQTGVRRPRLALTGGVAFGGLSLLVKFSTGVLTLGMLVLSVAVLAGPGRRRGTLAAAGAGAAGLLVSFVAFGMLTGHPTAFGTWLRASRQIASGYVAMALESPPTTRGNGMAPVLLLSYVFVLLAGVLALRARAAAQVVGGTTLVLVGYVLFREGYTRHDTEHVAIFLGAMALLPFGLVLGRRSRLVLIPLVLAPLSLAVFANGNLHPKHRVRFATDTTTVRTVLDRLRTAVDPGPVQRQGRQDLRKTYDLPPEVLSALRGHRTQVDPYDTAVLWAYGLEWGPSAVWALYSSYTPWLDDANASSLRSGTGPDRILRRVNASAIDTREPAFESPAYQLEELCGWRELVRSPGWQVLEPVRGGCGAPRPLATVQIVPGVPVDVPAPRQPGGLVTVRLELDLPLKYLLGALAFKPLHEENVLLDGKLFRLVVANAGQPLVMHSLSVLTAGLPDQFLPVDHRTLQVDLPGTAVFEERDPITP